MSTTTTRRSKRKLRQLPSIGRQQKSALQLHFESAIESPGGISKILHLVQNADAHDIRELNTAQWTPLVGAIFRFGKNTTKNGNSAESQEQLVQLVRACHQRGISMNSGAWFGQHYHHPLMVAAFYGYHAAVRLLVELGALPDLGDGEGRNALFAAFQNPVVTGGNHCLRECDKCTVRVLLDLGVVTNDLGLWKRSPKGSLCYINGDSSGGSVMLRALTNKNVDVVCFLSNAQVGGVITDRDYLELRHRGQLKSRKQLIQRVKSWHTQIDWSFPPTWKVGVILCQNCGLPPDIFRSYVVPFLDRDCFYTHFNGRLPLLGPSSGERVGSCRQLEWMNLAERHHHT
ncbi:hypothetical protein ACHAXR_002893 [Thalassiosira sp. AJA248-18]